MYISCTENIFYTSSSTDSLTTAIKPNGKEKFLLAAMLLFYINKITPLTEVTSERYIQWRYELDCPGIEFRWRQFRTRPNRPWDPPSLLYNGYQAPFLRAKRSGRGAEVKEIAELYLYFLLGVHGLF
jgi:hypothetical protein